MGVEPNLDLYNNHFYFNFNLCMAIEMINEIGDLELNVMSCLLIKPELMENIKLEDKHFQKHQRLWKFMKAFYEKFKTFDVQLMYSVCKDKWHIVHYMQMLVMLEPTYTNFDLYQKQIIEQYEENEKDKILIDVIYELANKLYVRKISTSEFKQKIDEYYQKIKNESL